MNSWGNDKLEAKIEEMLTSSVSRGSEPAGFRVQFMPRRPAFPWLSVVYVLIGAVILGFFFAQWLGGQNLENADYGSLFSFSRLSDLFSDVSTTELISGLAIALGLGGAIMAFLPEKQQVFRYLM